MVSALFNWAAIGIHYFMTWFIFPCYLECLVHCIQFDSWVKCDDFHIEVYLCASAIYGISGFLWVLANCREYHILYLWLIVTAQLIGITFVFLGYALKFVSYSFRIELLLYPVFLVISFLLVLMHVLVAKDIITNRWIKGFITGCMSLTGKIA